MRKALFLCFCFLLLTCRPLSVQESMQEDEAYSLALPVGFPAPTIPLDNKLTKKRVQFGEMLFFDNSLSIDSTISCASCHLPHRAFSDTLAISPGVKAKLGFRNAPTLANVAYHPYFFREGGNPTLEQQTLGPIEDPNEMAIPSGALIKRLQANPVYVRLAREAYGRAELDLFAITRALAAYERTLLFGNSAFDQWQAGDSTALSAAAKRGRDIFFSEKAQCSSCHAGFNFTEYAILNNGLQLDYTSDPGLYRRTGKQEDIGKFKVPTLRNIALTAPYMHDGRLTTLEAVVAHYNAGGQPHPNKDPRIQPLRLSVQEQADLVAFLQALTSQ